jgi:hypothetical protein
MLLFNSFEVSAPKRALSIQRRFRSAHTFVLGGTQTRGQLTAQRPGRASTEAIAMTIIGPEHPNQNHGE